MHVADIARICHEALRAAQLTHARQPEATIVVPPHWDELDADEQQPYLDGVKHAQDGATPVQLHERWCESRKRDGWQFSDRQDPGGKMHPLLVPYEMLAPEQQAMAAVFRAIVGALAA